MFDIEETKTGKMVMSWPLLTKHPILFDILGLLVNSLVGFTFSLMLAYLSYLMGHMLPNHGIPGAIGCGLGCAILSGFRVFRRERERRAGTEGK
jgi:hypothetical protein